MAGLRAGYWVVTGLYPSEAVFVQLKQRCDPRQGDRPGPRPAIAPPKMAFDKGLVLWSPPAKGLARLLISTFDLNRSDGTWYRWLNQYGVSVKLDGPHDEIRL